MLIPRRSSRARQLADDGDNVKALFIRASSFMKKKEYALARDDYDRVLVLRPTVRAPCDRAALARAAR